METDADTGLAAKRLGTGVVALSDCTGGTRILLNKPVDVGFFGPVTVDSSEGAFVVSVFKDVLLCPVG